MPKSPRKGGEGQRNYLWTSRAYCKALQHSLKHGSDSCVGILIGHSRSDGSWEVQDAIPVTHSHLLSPMAKIIFMLVEKHCKSLEPHLDILGIYCANAAASDLEVPPVAKPLAEKITSGTAWVIDANKIAKGVPAITGYFPGSTGNFGNISPENVVVDEQSIRLNDKMTKALTYLDVVDFDEHFSNPALDWLNSDLFAGLADESELSEIPE